MGTFEKRLGEIRMLRLCSICKIAKDWKPNQGPSWYVVHKGIGRVADICPECWGKIILSNSEKPEIVIETDRGEISKEELDDIMKKSLEKRGVK